MVIDCGTGDNVSGVGAQGVDTSRQYLLNAQCRAISKFEFTNGARSQRIVRVESINVERHTIVELHTQAAPNTAECEGCGFGSGCRRRKRRVCPNHSIDQRVNGNAAGIVPAQIHRVRTARGDSVY